ncbi:hypothetical protein KAR91_75215 [Candidatus Pacearchaeota archaeon]|nr:hypothetical protein [Candidatus Pacearchaeota archaeon]
MAIFLKNSWNVPPARWGSFADVQYAVKINAEKIYDIDPDSFVLNLPLFWGFPTTDYSTYRAPSSRVDVLYNNQSVDFNGTTSRITIPDADRFSFGNASSDTPFTVFGRIKKDTSDVFPIISKAWLASGPLEWLLTINNSGQVQLLLYGVNSFHWIRSLVDSDLTSDGWVDILGTYDGSGSNTGITIFINGREVAQTKGSTGSYVAMYNTSSVVEIGASLRGDVTWKEFADGRFAHNFISNIEFTQAQAAKFTELPFALYQKVSRPFHLLPIAPGPFTGFNDLGTEISGGSESIQDLTTDIQVNAESFFDLQTEISATTVQTILDLDTEISAAFNISFEDLNTDIQAVAKSFADLNTEITANSEFIFYDLSSEIAASALNFYDLNTEVITNAQTVSDLNTDIQARGDTFYDLSTDIQAKEYLFYDLNTEISVIRSKYWLDTEIEALSYARWNFNTEWNPNRFLNTEIAAKKPYTFSFKTKTGSSYVASSSEIEILLSGYSWPLRTLFLDYLRVGTSNVYNFELWWARGQSGKNPLKNAKIKAEYTNTQFAGGYEVVTCDWLSIKIDGGASQTVNATPLDLGDMPCDSKLNLELTVDCRDCSISRGLIFFRLIVTGDYQESLYSSVGYGDGSQYFEGAMDDYQSPNFIARLYVIG